MKQPTEKQQVIIDKYIGGLSSNEIANELDIHPNCILKVLKQYSIPRRGPNRPKKLETEIRAMEAMYKDGYSLEDVGKEFGIGAGLVLRYFKRLDIPRRSSEEAHRIYPIYEDFFDVIDTEEKAYFLGFLYADGCNQTNHYYAVNLSLNEIDRDILNKLSLLIYKNASDSQKQITIHDRRHENRDRGIMHTLHINSKHICFELMKKGCMPRKTFLLQYPIWLDRKLHRHFIRGYFDGDGTINNETKKLSGCKIVSTKEFIEGMHKHTIVKGNIYKNDDSEEAKDKNTWVIAFSGNRNIQKFLNWMYAGATIYLERKYQAYLRFSQKMEEIDRKTLVGTRGYPKAHLHSNYPEYHQVLNINGVELTADNVAQMSKEDKQYMAHDILDRLRHNGFNFTFDKRILDDYKKLCEDTKFLISLEPFSRLCTILCKSYCRDFYGAKYLNKPSVIEAFNDDELLMKCIENRLGLNWITKEKFAISFSNIVRGFASSGICYNVSIFKPAVAKYVYHKYSEVGDTVYDYSAGWGTRMLGATSCGRKYIGVDPLTTPSLIELKTDLGLKDVQLIQDGSENVDLGEDCVDFAFSSPPYYNLEVYSSDNTQAYAKDEDYFYNVYWKKTLSNTKRMLKPGKWFGLNVSGYPQMLDMAKECFGNIIEQIPLHIQKTHFTKHNIPKYENVYMFRK
jgi:transposase